MLLPRVGCAVRQVCQGAIDDSVIIDDGVNVYTAIVLAAFCFYWALWYLRSPYDELGRALFDR